MQLLHEVKAYPETKEFKEVIKVISGAGCTSVLLSVATTSLTLVSSSWRGFMSNCQRVRRE